MQIMLFCMDYAVLLVYTHVVLLAYMHYACEACIGGCVIGGISVVAVTASSIDSQQDNSSMLASQQVHCSAVHLY